MNIKEKLSTKVLILIGIMAAFSAILQQLEIPVGGFLKMDFSDLPSVVLSAFYGPIPGVLTELIKNIIKLLTTKTAFIGELANFIVGVGLVIPIGIGFNKLRKNGEYISFKKTVYVFAIAVITMTVVGAIINYFVLIPFYAKFVGGEEVLVKQVNTFLPIVKSKLGIIMLYITPFNIVKGIVVSCLSNVLIYLKIKK